MKKPLYQRPSTWIVGATIAACAAVMTPLFSTNSPSDPTTPSASDELSASPIQDHPIWDGITLEERTDHIEVLRALIRNGNKGLFISEPNHHRNEMLDEINDNILPVVLEETATRNLKVVILVELPPKSQTAINKAIDRNNPDSSDLKDLYIAGLDRQSIENVARSYGQDAKRYFDAHATARTNTVIRAGELGVERVIAMDIFGPAAQALIDFLRANPFQEDPTTSLPADKLSKLEELQAARRAEADPHWIKTASKQASDDTFVLIIGGDGHMEVPQFLGIPSMSFSVQRGRSTNRLTTEAIDSGAFVLLPDALWAENLQRQKDFISTQKPQTLQNVESLLLGALNIMRFQKKYWHNISLSDDIGVMLSDTCRETTKGDLANLGKISETLASIKRRLQQPDAVEMKTESDYLTCVEFITDACIECVVQLNRGRNR